MWLPTYDDLLVTCTNLYISCNQECNTHHEYLICGKTQKISGYRSAVCGRGYPTHSLLAAQYMYKLVHCDAQRTVIMFTNVQQGAACVVYYTAILCVYLNSYLLHNNADSASIAVALDGGNLGTLWQGFWKNLGAVKLCLPMMIKAMHML